VAPRRPRDKTPHTFLATMSNSFVQKKQKILDAINVSHTEYSDLSPKGSIDDGIRETIDVINSIPGLVTTSSCAGRVSIYVEGLKKNPEQHTSNEAIAGSGGKGGGRWIFVSHDPLSLETSEWSMPLLSKFGLQPSNQAFIPNGASLAHLKFEPMVSKHRHF
jgi:tRNA wybutosine-synthesizing protein 3